MAKEKHVHKFRRRKYKSTGAAVFFCVEPDCTFKIGVEFSFGKRNICWRCGEPFQLTPYSLRLAKPHCEDCHGKKGTYVKSHIQPGEDRREIPTRRELDPTVLPTVASTSVQSLKERLNNPDFVPIKYQTIPSSVIDEDDDEDDADLL